ATASSPAAGPGVVSMAPSAGPGTKASPRPTVSAGQAAPATGSYTKKQKEYLTGRVPKGMDPAAVLQTGQETCDRLDYLVKVDRDIAVGAIASGEITGAKPAVAHLCTGHRDLVAEAALSYADGTHTGKELRPGRYHAVSPTRDCAWTLAGAGGKELASGSSATGKRVDITVPASARTFTSTGCYAWLPRGDNAQGDNG
ncbi:MAG TPA: hypothetical protein VIS29_02110, partial [Streptomyces sp.]